jgi:hypothetical protein
MHLAVHPLILLTRFCTYGLREKRFCVFLLEKTPNSYIIKNSNFKLMSHLHINARKCDLVDNSLSHPHFTCSCCALHGCLWLKICAGPQVSRHSNVCWCLSSDVSYHPALYLCFYWLKMDCGAPMMVGVTEWMRSSLPSPAQELPSLLSALSQKPSHERLMYQRNFFNYCGK